MATVPTPTWSVINAHVSYVINTGEIFQEFDLNQAVVAQLTDTEFNALLTSLDAGVLAHATDPGQITRHVTYAFSGDTGISTVIRAS